MSAIFGLYRRDRQPISHVELQSMSDKLAHRGTDAARTWLDMEVGLGHRMLWTTPESLGEHLPLDEKSSGLVITADARIDNREELSAGLELTRPLAELSDSELILASYAKWGEQCPEKLTGDFVFAIWDRRNEKLFCARDHIGVRSLYYYLSERTFALATEIKALLCLPEVPRHLNETRVADFLVQVVEDRVSTFFKDVVRLPAAHSITVDKDGARIRRYWSLDPSRKLRLSSDDEFTEAFRAIFNEAVRCRVRSAFPVGSTLSGGLDSSSIACTARNLLKQQGVPLNTFSAIFPSLPEKDLRAIDERKYMDAVISQGGFEPYYLRADLLSPLSDFDKVLWHGDEVYWGPNLYIHWGLYRAAKERGVRIFLDGLDGDTTVSHGLAFLTELAWTGRWMKLISEARALSKIGNSCTPRKIIWEYGFRPLVPDRAFRMWRFLRGRSQKNGAETSILNQDFAKRIDMAGRVRELQEKSDRIPCTARQSHFDGLNFALHPYVLELADKSAAAFGLEPRYPFYDRRLMEFCLAMPAEQKLSQGWTRAIIRRAMTDVLPPEILFRRDKANLSSNFRRKLFEYELDLITRVYQTGSIRKYVDEETFKNTYDRYISSASTGKKDALTIYGIVALTLWFQKSNLTCEVTHN
jgi:asparagine synthase (glutamine-hydrolysing)